MQRGIKKTAPPCTGGAARVATDQMFTLLPVKTMMVAVAVAIAVVRTAAVDTKTDSNADARLNNDRSWHSAIAIPVASLRSLSHPLTDGAAVAIISDDLVNGHDGGATGGVAYDPGLALAFSFGIGGCCKTKNCGCSEDGEECFHWRVEFVSALSDVTAPRLFSPDEIFFQSLLRHRFGIKRITQSVPQQIER